MMKNEMEMREHKAICDMNDIKAIVTGCDEYERRLRGSSFPSAFETCNEREIYIASKVILHNLKKHDDR